MICKECNKEVVRDFSGRSDKRRKRIYINSKGEQWKGRKCPDCQNRLNVVSLFKKKRLCGKQGGMPGCGKVLEPTRYFNCKDCMHEKDDDVDGIHTYDAA